MKAIARHLNEQNYDIVFLQEVGVISFDNLKYATYLVCSKPISYAFSLSFQIWLESDFSYIKSVVKSKFKFSYFYKNSSFFGNPGRVA